jgi:hypothetical protein
MKPATWVGTCSVCGCIIEVSQEDMATIDGVYIAMASCPTEGCGSGISLERKTREPLNE